MSEPLAYFISFTTYGTRLHGCDSGSVDRQHNVPGTLFLPADAGMAAARRRAMRQESYVLDEAKRKIVMRTIREVATYRHWKLWAVHVRTNHIHIVVSATPKPEKVMADFKAWASRRLREAFAESADRDRWTQHGSTSYLNTQSSLDSAVVYVVDEQGEKMACYDCRSEPNASNEPEA